MHSVTKHLLNYAYKCKIMEPKMMYSYCCCCCFHLSVVVQSLNRVQLFATAWTAVCQASLAFTISQSLLKLMPIELVSPLSSPSNHLILYHPLLLLPLIFPNIKVFSDELTLCIRWPKYQSFCISPSYEYSGLISFRTD